MLLFITFHISSNNKLIICFVDKCVWNIDYRSINRVSMRGNLAKSSKKSTSFDSAVLLHRIYPIDIEWICSDMYEDVYISIVQNTKKSRYGRKCSSVRDFLNNLWYSHAVEYSTALQRRRYTWREEKRNGLGRIV